MASDILVMAPLAWAFLAKFMLIKLHCFKSNIVSALAPLRGTAAEITGLVLNKIN
jgi:hypothetical protein